uniref:Uncharacterized protein n=1 Tax=Magallana gigas TaxID=29159 RepID=K1RT01_MAGGI
MLKVLGEATTKFASVHAQGASCREHQRLPQYHGQHLSGHAPDDFKTCQKTGKKNKADISLSSCD